MAGVAPKGMSWYPEWQDAYRCFIKFVRSYCTRLAVDDDDVETGLRLGDLADAVITHPGEHRPDPEFEE